MEQSPGNNKFLEFTDTISKIPIPSWIKKNVLTALGKGVGNIITSGLDWPTAWFELKAKELRAKAAGNESVQSEAAKQASLLFKSKNELADRALNYYACKIVEGQINRENVATHFISELTDQNFQDVEQEADIDEDWLNTFWRICETKSSEEIKIILGKILARKVAAPDSISPVTLQLIPLLTSDIGMAFHKLCNLSIRDEDGFTFVVHPHFEKLSAYGDLEEYGISLDDQFELEGIGLIRSVNVVPMCIIPSEGDFESCDYAGVKAKFNFAAGVSVIDFTRAGRELRNLLELKPNEKYTKFLVGLGAGKFQLADS